MSETESAIQLLVSVRSVEEAVVALEAGADIIDVKEPARGPMGRADFRVIGEILAHAAIPASVRKTVALGELVAGELEQSLRKLSALGVNVAAKVGFSGAITSTHLLSAFVKSALAHRPNIELVPVFYADHREIHCPRFELLLDLAVRAQSGFMLVDTHTKDGRKIWNWISPEIMAWMVSAAAERGIRLAVAGSLSAVAVRRFEQPFPAVVGVRGGVCRSGSRVGKLDPDLIRGMKAELLSLTRPQPERDSIADGASSSE